MQQLTWFHQFQSWIHPHQHARPLQPMAQSSYHWHQHRGHTNILQGLLQLINRTKIAVLKDLVACNQAFSIVLIEMHLKPDIADAEIHTPKYLVLQSNRKDRNHVGVVMYTHEDLTCPILLLHSNSMCDSQGVHIRQFDIIIYITSYRPIQRLPCKSRKRS